MSNFVSISHIAFPPALCVMTFSTATATTNKQTAVLLLPLWTCSGRGSRRAKEGDGGHATRWQSCWLVCCLPLPTMLFHHAPFFPLNAFYSNFKASPALFSHFFLFHPCFAWLCLWSRIGPGIKKHGYWKRKLAGVFFPSLFFPLLLTARFLHFTSRSPTAERPLLLLSPPRRFF